jgi:hypothetical protein
VIITLPVLFSTTRWSVPIVRAPLRANCGRKSALVELGNGRIVIRRNRGRLRAARCYSAAAPGAARSARPARLPVRRLISRPFGSVMSLNPVAKEKKQSPGGCSQSETESG